MKKIIVLAITVLALSNPLLAGPGDNPKDADCDCGPSDTSGDYSEIDGKKHQDGVTTPADPEDPIFSGTWKGKFDGKHPVVIKFIERKNGEIKLEYQYISTKSDGELNKVFVNANDRGKTVDFGKITLLKGYDSTGKEAIIAVGKFDKTRQAFLSKAK
jgi:hypothetical protein